MMEMRSILFVVLSATVAYVQGEVTCAPKFTFNTGHYCFKYIEEKMTYSEARARCSSIGSVVAHPAAQDWETWRQDVRAVTRNDHSLWVGTTRNINTWKWLNTAYNGDVIPINKNLKKEGDISIPKSAWSSKANHKCKPLKVNGTLVNGGMANITLEENSNSTNSNSTEVVDPRTCGNDTASCAYFNKDGKLKDAQCDSKAHYVLCQGPIDYSKSCNEDDHNCTDNAYHIPISFNLCGCKCKEDYFGDGYSDCSTWSDINPGLAMFGIVLGALIMFSCCFIGVRKQMNTKSNDKTAVKKTWSLPAMGFFVGLALILVCL